MTALDSTMANIMFDEKVAAQVAGFFLAKAGGTLPVLKLMKLMYFAERKHIEQFGEPMIFDTYVSMKKGPVLSITYDLIQNHPVKRENWDRLIASRQGDAISLNSTVSISNPDTDFEALSENNVEVLNLIWDRYKNVSGYNMSNLSHDFKEWKCPPNNSTLPIHYEDILDALNFSQEKKEAYLAHIEELCQIEQAFQNL